MCRFAAMFSNEPILVADILTKPRMSLIRQSYAAQERQHPVGIPGLSYQQSTLNGDGYGIAWYRDVDDIDASGDELLEDEMEVNVDVERVDEDVVGGTTKTTSIGGTGAPRAVRSLSRASSASSASSSYSCDHDHDAAGTDHGLLPPGIALSADLGLRRVQEKLLKFQRIKHAASRGREAQGREKNAAAYFGQPPAPSATSSTSASSIERAITPEDGAGAADALEGSGKQGQSATVTVSTTASAAYLGAGSSSSASSSKGQLQSQSPQQKRQLQGTINAESHPHHESTTPASSTTRTAATSVTSSSAPVVSSRSQPTTKKPCVFTSLKPAWNDRNLSRLAEQVSSKCVFAHIRAAGPGSPVSDDACHPFEARGLLFMHNGMLADFEKHTRTLLGMLSEEGFRVALEHNCIDSAVAFGLYLTMLEELQEVEVTASSSTAAITHAYSADTLAAALKKTIDVLNRLGGPKEPSLLNFVVSDGKCILATRAGVGGDGASLYVCTGSNWVQEKLKKQCPNKPKARQQRLVEKQWKTSLGENTEDFAMENFEARPSVVIIASEPLSADRHDWVPVPPRTMVVVTTDRVCAAGRAGAGGGGDDANFQNKKKVVIESVLYLPLDKSCKDISGGAARGGEQVKKTADEQCDCVSVMQSTRAKRKQQRRNNNSAAAPAAEAPGGPRPRCQQELLPQPGDHDFLVGKPLRTTFELPNLELGMKTLRELLVDWFQNYCREKKFSTTRTTCSDEQSLSVTLPPPTVTFDQPREVFEYLNKHLERKTETDSADGSIQNLARAAEQEDVDVERGDESQSQTAKHEQHSASSFCRPHTQLLHDIFLDAGARNCVIWRERYLLAGCLDGSVRVVDLATIDGTQQTTKQSATTILGHNAAAVLALRIFRDRYLLSSSKVDLRVWDLHAALLAVEQSGISLATTSCTDHVHGPGPASSSTGTGGGAAVSFLSRTSSTPAGGGTTATAPPAPHRDVGRMKRTSSKVVEKNQNVACLVCFRFQPMQGQLLTVGRCDEGGREEGKFRVILGFSSCNLYELSIDLDCIRKQTSGRSHTIRFVTLSCDTTVREKYPLWKESFADVGAARTSPLLSKDRRLKALDCGRSVGGAGEELHNSDTVATLSTTTGGGDTTIGVDQGTAAARNGHCRYSKPPLEDIYSSLAGGPGADYRIPETYCSDPEPVTQLTGTASPRAVVVPQLLNASRSIMIARSPTTPVGSAGTPRNKSGRTSAMPKECQSLQFITQHRSCVYQVSYLPRNRMAVSVGGDGVLQVHYVSDQSAAGSPAAVRDQRQGGDGPIYCAAVCVNFEVRKTTSSSRLAAANGGQIVVGPGGKRVADSKDLPVGVPAAGDSGNSAGLKMTSTSQNTKRRFSYDGIYDVEQKDDHDEQSYTTLEHLSSYGTSRVHRHALENQNCAGAGGDEDVVDELPPLPQAISGDSFIHNGNSSPIPRDLSGVNPPSRPMNVGLQQLQQDLEARFSAAPEDEENSFPRSPPDFRLNVLEEDGLLSSGITEPEAAGRAEVENKDGRSTATTAHEHQPEVAPVVASPPHAIAKGRAGGLCAGASQEDFFVTGDESGKIKLWRVRNGELAFLKELPNNYVGLGAQASSSSRSTYDSRVLSLCLLRENLLIAGRGDGAVDLYDLYRCKLVERKYIGGSLFATSALSLPQQMTGQTPCQCIRRINEDRFCCVSNFGVLLFEVLGEGAKTSLQPTISSRKAAAMVPTAADGPDARLAQHLRGEMQNLSRGRAGRAPHHSEGDGVDAALETTTQVEELPEPSSRGPNVKIRFLHVRTTFEERIGDREQDHEATEISNSFRTDLMYDDKAAFLSSVAETLRRRSGKKIIILSSSPAGLKFVIGGTVSASGGDRPLHDRRRILLHTNCASPIDELLEMLASFSLSDSEQRKDDTAVEVTLVVDDGTWQEWGAPDADEHNVDRSGTAFPANAEDLDHQNFFTRLIYFAPNVDDEEVANATWTGRKLMMETSGGGPGLFMLQAKGIEELLEGLARLSGVAKVLSVHDSRALVMLVRSCECDRDKLEQEGLLTARPVKLPGLLQDNWSGQQEHPPYSCSGGAGADTDTSRHIRDGTAKESEKCLTLSVPLAAIRDYARVRGLLRTIRDAVGGGGARASIKAFSSVAEVRAALLET